VKEKPEDSQLSTLSDDNIIVVRATCSSLRCIKNYSCRLSREMRINAARICETAPRKRKRERERERERSRVLPSAIEVRLRGGLRNDIKTKHKISLNEISRSKLIAGCFPRWTNSTSPLFLFRFKLEFPRGKEKRPEERAATRGMTRAREISTGA